MNNRNDAETEKRVQIVVIVILSILLVLLVVGVTYAVFSFTKMGTVVNQITTGTVTMNYEEVSRGITISNAMPTTDEMGKVVSDEDYIFDFTVDVNITGKQAVIYQITAAKKFAFADGTTIAQSTIDDSTGKKVRGTALDDNEVRLYLESGSSAVSISDVAMEPSNFVPLTDDTRIGAKRGEMLLATVGCTESKLTYYRLRMWVDKDYLIDETPRKFAVVVNVYGKDATESEVADLTPTP